MWRLIMHYRWFYCNDLELYEIDKEWLVSLSLRQIGITNKQKRNNKTNRMNDMEIAEHVASYA